MAPENDDLDLAELADQAGVSVRTIRYYQQQGLINAPGVRGPGAKYGEPDLNRLKLINALKREHLPLAEIRRRMEQLDDQQVGQALVEAPQAARESAAEYARALLSGSAVYPMRPHDSALSQYYTSPRPWRVGSGPAPRTNWERIEVAPDIELHVRRPLSRYENKRLEQAIELMTRFLNEEDTP